MMMTIIGKRKMETQQSGDVKYRRGSEEMLSAHCMV